MTLAEMKTFSDAGPWCTYSDVCGDDMHVVPGFEGRRHEIDDICWCHPVYEQVEDGQVIHHNVAQ